MRAHKSVVFGRITPIILGGLTAWLSILCFADRAQAIPVFARKYATSCITCHAGFPKLNGVGEAFRRNGYQFPQDDDLLVKDEPILMGNEAYKDMWPNAIWPSDIPHLPPVSLRARLGYKQFLNTPPGGHGEAAPPSTDFQFPMDYSLLSAGTLGENISWYAGMVLAGKGGHGGGGHGGGDEGLEPELERMFVQFSNLFAWSRYDDDDGMREGNRWISLPQHALNLRVGQFEPGVIAPWASIHRQWGITGRLPNVVSLSDAGFDGEIQNTNMFSFEPAQRGFELHGTLRQYNSYAVGLVNGNGSMGAWDNNTDVDFYFRVARKWFGFPLDGVLGEAQSDENGEGEDEDVGGGLDPGMDFWREIQFETGFFGYTGRNSVMVDQEFEYEVTDEDAVDHHLELVERVGMLSDKFERIGVDGRFQFQDLDIFGVAYWGRNGAPGAELENGNIEVFRDIDLFTWFLEANYHVKPWLTPYVRYEQLHFDSHHFQDHKGIDRAVLGAVFTVRANMRIVTEFLIDAKGPNDEGEYTTHDTFTAMLDFAF